MTAQSLKQWSCDETCSVRGVNEHDWPVFLVGHVAAFASDTDVELLFLGDQKGHKPSLHSQTCPVSQ